MSAISEPGKRYHHGDLRAALIAAGLELTRAGGPDALVLREATRRAGVSPSAAYRHFADRERLLAAVSDAVLERVAAAMRPDAPDHGAPAGSPPGSGDAALQRLRAVGRGYIAFARAEPGWFETAFFGPHRTPASVRDAAPFRALSDALDAVTAAGLLPASSREGAEWPCWSAVHGFTGLVLDGPLRGADAGLVGTLADRVVDTVIAGLLADRGAAHAPLRR